MKNNQIARQMGTVHLLRELSSVVIKVKFLGKGKNANHYLRDDNLTVANSVLGVLYLNICNTFLSLVVHLLFTQQKFKLTMYFHIFVTHS